MSRRAGHSLLLLHREVLARLDLPPTAGAAALRRAERPAVDDLAAMLELAAGEEPLRAAVWVLSDEPTTQRVTLPARAVRGLKPVALAAALAFEAQESSGLPTGAGVTAFVPVPGAAAGATFDVAQMARADIEALAATAAALGGRLAAVAPIPAGAPDLGHADEAALAEWLAGVGGTLAERRAGLPLLLPPPRPLSPVLQASLAALLAAVVLLGAAADRAQLHEQRAALGAELSPLLERLDRAAREREQLAALRTELARLEAQAPVAPGGARWSGDLPGQVMDAVAAARPPGLLLREFQLDAQRSSLRGESVEAALADGLVTALAPLSAAHGYDVGIAGQQLLTGGLYDFEVSLVPARHGPASVQDDAP